MFVESKTKDRFEKYRDTGKNYAKQRRGQICRQKAN